MLLPVFSAKLDYLPRTNTALGIKVSSYQHLRKEHKQTK